jgi:hypothetical protein
MVRIILDPSEFLEEIKVDREKALSETKTAEFFRICTSFFERARDLLVGFYQEFLVFNATRCFQREIYANEVHSGDFGNFLGLNGSM